MKNLFFLALPPKRKDDHFAGLLPVASLQDAKDFQKEIGGTIRIVQIYFN